METELARLRTENESLRERLAEAHRVLAGYNAWQCGPNTAFLLGVASVGGDDAAVKAAQTMSGRGT